MKKKNVRGLLWLIIPPLVLGFLWILWRVLWRVSSFSPSEIILIAGDVVFVATYIALLAVIFGIPFSFYLFFSQNPVVFSRGKKLFVWILVLVVILGWSIFASVQRAGISKPEVKSSIDASLDSSVGSDFVQNWVSQVVSETDPGAEQSDFVVVEAIPHSNSSLNRRVILFSRNDNPEVRGLLMIDNERLVNSFYIPHWYPEDRMPRVENVHWTTDTIVEYEFVNTAKRTKAWIDTEMDVMGLELVNDF